ncbi:hypothetical protein P5495_021875 [Bacillus velezensis]|uniref:hypothetical protein n=1 Tax=Bacillus velezensis TaxID=492670 RepID=UPI0037F08781|nr:hypothetical protein [Bacillus velezensis]MDH3104068.1 hypothetical protein [Bacillus velezensis]MDH3139028.1 hypothetical protein [Bacillus velezensis]
MGRRRKNQYEHGDRCQVNLSQNVDQSLLDWINKQSEISGFFLLAAQALYEKIGNIDSLTHLPRYFSLPEDENDLSADAENSAPAKPILNKSDKLDNIQEQRNNDLNEQADTEPAPELIAEDIPINEPEENNQIWDEEEIDNDLEERHINTSIPSEENEEVKTQEQENKDPWAGLQDLPDDGFA